MHLYLCLDTDSKENIFKPIAGNNAVDNFSQNIM